MDPPAVPEEQPKVAKVTFNPPLWLQRRTWVLTQLREHRSTSVLDLGCGEGSLLSVLCQPASVIPPSQPSRTTSANEPPEPTLDIHIRHLVGLDVDEPSLALAVEETVPPPTSNLDDLPPWERPRPRWLDMDVQIWKGGLEFLNGDQNGWFGSQNGAWDAIVSTEVVEHLPPSLLPYFIPVTLGIYQPTLLLLTTPNYTFNQLFTAPGTLNTLTGYPDPTGETDRIFRHHDHKREWTTEEWGEWCEVAAREWAYDVLVDGVGTAEEDDPWGRTNVAGKASLTAVFKRKDPPLDLEERAALERKREDAFRAARQRTTPQTAHHLLAAHHFASHPLTGTKPTRTAILDALKNLLEPTGELGLRCGSTDIDELWLQDPLAILCGGDLDLLLDAIETAPQDEWELIKEVDDAGWRWRERKWAWRVRWKGFVKPPTPEPEPESVDGEARDWWHDDGWNLPRAAWSGWAEEDEREDEEDAEHWQDGELGVERTPPTTPSPGEPKEKRFVTDGWGTAPTDSWGSTGDWTASNWASEEPSWT